MERRPRKPDPPRQDPAFIDEILYSGPPSLVASLLCDIAMDSVRREGVSPVLVVAYAAAESARMIAWYRIIKSLVNTVRRR